MSDLDDRLELIKTELATRYPARVVTRELMDPANRKDADLTKGVYTIVSFGEGNYRDNRQDISATYGDQHIVIGGEIRLSEKKTTLEVEQAELAMVEELKDFVRNLPAALYGLTMLGFRQSGQVSHPYGYIVVDMEFRP